MPPSLREWLPQDHLAWFVIDAVDELDLTAFYAAYRDDGQGRPAFDPVVMVAVLVFSYAVGVRSSRQIERRCVEDVATRVVAGNLSPDHVTIARFRTRHEHALAGLFAQVLGLCARAGLVRAGTVAVDGTKLHANASLGANRSVEGLREHAQQVLDDAAETDRQEDELFGERRGDELPEELANPATRAGRIRQLLDELDAERQAAQAQQDAKVDAYEAHVERTGKRPPGRPPTRQLHERVQERLSAPVNLTDPDSRIVRDKGALIQGYNAQAVVGEGQIVIAARLAEDANDTRQLQPMIDAARHELARAGIDQPINEVLADSGYWNTGQMDVLAKERIETLIPTSSSRDRPRVYKPRQGPHAKRIEQTLATDEGARRYRRRQQIVEPVFAHIKHLRTITRLSRRGRQAAQAEWQLITATHNLLKLYRSPLRAA